MSSNGDHGLLVCPETKLLLRECSLEEAQDSIAGGAGLVSRPSGQAQPVGPTPRVFVREDGACAYPVLDDIPMLLVPERLLPPDRAPLSVDLTDPRYAEAYEEMEYYNTHAGQETSAIETSAAAAALTPLIGLSEAERRAFPDPADVWLDATYEPAAQWDAYRHVRPLEEARVLQLGGRGTHAVRFLLAGAAEAVVISPMPDELRHALALADHFDLAKALRCFAAVAEELPFADHSFDVVYVGGCMHHTVTGLAFSECARVLRPGGRFAAVEPWRAPFYGLGTRVFGKREAVHCRPMDPVRTSPAFDAFVDAEVVHHGALTRYPLLVMAKFGLTLPLTTVWKISRLDDAACSHVPPIRRAGSSVAVLGTSS